MSRYVLAFLLGALAAIWEILFRSFLPYADGLRPLLAIVVLFLVASGRPKALVAAITGGLFLDLYTFGTIDFAIVRWACTAAILDLLLAHLLTNRSLLAAVALGLAGRLFDFIFIALLAAAMRWFGAASVGYSIPANWWQIFLWDAALISVGFFLLAVLTKRFLTRIQRADDRGARSI